MKPLTAIQPRGRSLQDVLNDLLNPKQNLQPIQEAEQKESAALSIPRVLEAIRTGLKERGGAKEWGKVSPSVFPTDWV